MNNGYGYPRAQSGNIDLSQRTELKLLLDATHREHCDSKSGFDKSFLRRQAVDWNNLRIFQALRKKFAEEELNEGFCGPREGKATQRSPSSSRGR